MYTNVPIVQKPYQLLLLLLATFSIFILSAIPKDAQAEPSRRVCVNEANTLAFKVGLGGAQKVSCENSFNDVKTHNIGGAPWGTGKYMTCANFASNFLKWEPWDPCYDMQTVRINVLNSNYNVPFTKIHSILAIKKDTKIYGDSERNASGSSLVFSFSQSKNFSYSYGVGLSDPAGVFGADVSYSHGSSSTDGSSVVYNYQPGQMRGLSLDFIGKNSDDFRRIDQALFNRFKPWVKNFSYANDAHRRRLDPNTFCNAPFTPVVGFYAAYSLHEIPSQWYSLRYITTTDVKKIPYQILGFGLINGSSSEALDFYDKRVASAETARQNGFYVGIPTWSGIDYIVCGLNVIYGTSASIWRDGQNADPSYQVIATTRY